jgi:4-aminobutyrate aminotransferase-like enzyme
MPGVHVAPYAYCHRCPCKQQRKSAEDCCNQPLLAVEMLLRQQTGPADTAAILLVPTTTIYFIYLFSFIFPNLYFSSNLFSFF